VGRAARSFEQSGQLSITAPDGPIVQAVTANRDNQFPAADLGDQPNGDQAKVDEPAKDRPADDVSVGYRTFPEGRPRSTCQINRTGMLRGGIASTIPIRCESSRWTLRKAARLPEEADGELERGVLDLIIVPGVEAFDLGVGYVQLRLR
jgi:hypothetical protein